MLVHRRYEVGKELGRGAQGVVLRVVDREAPARALVAKVWREGAFGQREIEGEFRLLARLRVPGVVRAHDFGADERTGAPFFVEDFVDGPDAVAYVADPPSGRNSGAGSEFDGRAGRLARVLADVARALASLHDAHFVHGDLKPAHVRIGARGATLLDLGAAIGPGRTCDDAASIGLTRVFAAPEALGGAAPTVASDLFALGATAWAAATGSPPQRKARLVRAHAPWVPPSLEAVIAALLAEHPADRPRDAREVLALLGRSGAMGRDESLGIVGRLREIAAILESAETRGDRAESVHWLVGPPGIGKSEIAREAITRTLLAGREARVVEPDDVVTIARVVAWLRGARDAWPFTSRPIGRHLLVIDDLERAPKDLAAALEAYRCRVPSSSDVAIVVTAREAPAGAPGTVVAPLDPSEHAALCVHLGIDDAAEIERLARQSGRVPGWIVASLGRVPLDRGAAVLRVAAMSQVAKDLLAAIAIAGGSLSFAVAATVAGGVARATTALHDLAGAALVTRRPGAGSDPRTSSAPLAVWSLSAPPLASDLAGALGSFDLVDRVADALLASSEVDARSLLALAHGGDWPPTRRAEVLARAAARARNEGLRAEETDALDALVADPRERTVARVRRLERLTRDAGTGRAHERAVAWLDELASAHPEVLPLALRRRAEKAARAGDPSLARRLADEAVVAARPLDGAARGFALATRGAVLLYSAEWSAAGAALVEARSLVASEAGADAEEQARLDHNLGVVALYRNDVELALEALGESLAIKRALGDSAGVRSCLLNLGIAFTKAKRFSEGARALEEAARLARSLGQRAGLGWCLAAHADLEVKQRRPSTAERMVAEADALGDVLPGPVRADLALLRAEIELLRGAAGAALDALTKIEESTRAGDPMIDARAAVLEARACLASLPADRRTAARRAIHAVRRARAGELAEYETQAIDVLREARGARLRYASGVTPSPAPALALDARAPTDDALWEVVATIATADPGDAPRALLAAVLAASKAERAFLVTLDDEGRADAGWGLDLDGIALQEPERRVAFETIEAALSSARAAYLPQVETTGGHQGSRLAIASPDRRAVLVVEHRFATARFDHVHDAAVLRWRLLAALVARLAARDLAAPERSHGAVPSADDARPATFGGGSAVAVHASTAAPLLEPHRAFPAILGQSRALLRALARLEAAIETDLPVLVVGETGTGKELFSRAVHDLGPRARRPFVAVNCAAIPDALFEAELFGHARGSFTGAHAARAGLVARAEGGTLLLDEIGELHPMHQAALLRALETKRYRPVGSDEERAFDVRIVAATNRDLAAAVAEGSFRQDLLFRLRVLEVKVPALRDRAEDVELLARHFLGAAGSGAEIAPRALDALTGYAWPGNVRELAHHMQRLAALRVTRIDLEHLAREVRAGAIATATAEAGASQPPPRRGGAFSADEERDEVTRALERTSGNISQAATLLGLTRHGLKKRMLRLGLRAKMGSPS